MSDRLDAVAIVTGASKGIGRSIAHRLAKDGATVAVCARPSAALADTVRAAEQLTGKVHSVEVDATNPEAVTQAVAKVAATFGRIDALINNVGGAIEFGGFEDTPDEKWIQAYELNVLSAVRFSRAALPHLRVSNLKRIVNIASLSAIEPGTFNPHYAASKAGLLNLSKYLANYLASSGITVNAVCAGPVHSDSWDRNIDRTAGVRSLSPEVARTAVETEESAKVPLGRIGEGEDVAGVVRYLMSMEASWITGACISVDGGKRRSVF